MSTVAPPPPPNLPSAPAPVVPTLTVPNPPPSLTALSVNARIEGQVLAQLGNNQVQIQTPVGPLTVQTAIILPQNALLGLVIQTLTPQVKLQLTSIDGKQAQQALAAVPPGPPGRALPPPPVARLFRSQQVRKPSRPFCAHLRAGWAVLMPPRVHCRSFPPSAHRL